MIESIIILLLPLAAYSGWWVAMRREARALRQNKARASYFAGLNSLLNGRSDTALEIFSNFPVLDSSTVEIQLTLGTLLRNRGQLDRALHLHGQLYDRTDLNGEQRRLTTLELAADYHQAGMYVQAQELYELLLPTDFHREEVRQALTQIYERMAQWQKAIDLNVASRENLAHYYCCLAEEQPERHEELLAQALKMDSQCLRAHLLRAERLLAQGFHLEALSTYQSLAQLDVDLLPELLAPLANCYGALERLADFHRWLLSQEERQRRPSLTLAVLPHLPGPEARRLLQERFDQSASPFLLSEQLWQDLPAVAQKIAPQRSYRCDECGFRHHSLIWHCPACSRWSSFRPLLEIKFRQ